MASTFISPSIQITESFETRAFLPEGESAFVCGFTKEGPTDLPYYIESVNDFENLFGTPDSAAPEQAYAYYTAKEVIGSGANLIFSRLPYGKEEGDTVGDQYTAVVYPVTECDTSAQSISSHEIVGYESTEYVPASAFNSGTLSAFGDAYSNAFAKNDSGIIDDIFEGQKFTLDDPIFQALSSTGIGFNPIVERNDDMLVLGEPAYVQLTQNEYESFKCGDFNWSSNFTCDIGALSSYDSDEIGKAGMVVIDKSRSITNNQFTGYYLSITDNFNADPSTRWDSVGGVKYGKVDGYGTWSDVPETVYDFELTAEVGSNNAAVSRTIEAIGNQGVDGRWEDDQFKDHLNVTLWRLLPENGDATKLTPVIVESHVGSLDEDRTVIEQGIEKSSYLGNKVLANSNRLDIYINPNISNRSDWADNDGSRTLATRMKRSELPTHVTANCVCGEDADNLYSFSRFVPKTNTVARDVGNVPRKITNALCNVDNPELIDIDYTIDGGLSTIWSTVKSDRSQWITGDPRIDSYLFNDAVRLNVLDDLGRVSATAKSGGLLRQYWQTVFDIFETFVSETRPCNGGVGAVHVADPLRHVFVQGRDCKVWTGDKDSNSTFAELIYHPLKNLLSGTNTSYAVTYANWFKDVVVSGSTKLCWLPPSGKITKNIAGTPTPWAAVAGVQNGIVEGVKDMAISPRLRDRDLLYKIQANAIYSDKDYGNMIFAQQTLKRNNTMERELYVRRALLWFQKNALRIVKPFQFNANTIFIRTRLRNNLEPHYKTALQGGALEDYRISFEGNTPNELQAGILKVSFLLKFAGLIKFVRLDYNSLNSETPFSEVTL